MANDTAAQTGPADGKVTITVPEAQKVTAGSSDYFTGSVSVRALFNPQEPARASGGQVTFQPGARSAWHTHPLGQTLIITDGTGWVQEECQPVRVMHTGDVVWCLSGVKHWHGATATTSVTHIAIQEVQDGSAVKWLEQVTDDQYKLGN